MKIKVPTSWADVTVSQYDELRTYDIDTVIIFKLLEKDFRIEKKDFDTLIKTLSVLLDVSEDIIYKMDIESFDLILSKLKWLKPIVANKENKKNFNLIDVGKFVDLEAIIDKGLSDNYIRFVNKIFGKNMSNKPITMVYGEVYNYFNWRKKLFENFSGLFEIDENENIDINSAQELKHQSFNRKWNWYGFIYKLANGNILKMEEVTEVNIITAFNFLSYEREKSYLKS